MYLYYRNRHKICTSRFYIIPGTLATLLSYETAINLGVIPAIRSISEGRYSLVYEQYKDFFNGLEKLKDRQIKFHFDENVIPIAQAQRHIPFHVRDRVEKELENLVKMDVIEKVEGLTSWISNLVVLPKPKLQTKLECA